MENKFRVVIPAGGRSSRSGLSYPKTLYRLDGIPILIRILSITEKYDSMPILIINPAHEDIFREILNEFSKDVKIVFQHHPRGMGHAVLQADNQIEEDSHVILIWSDIPLLSKTTLKQLVNCHVTSKNGFSLVTHLGDNCYTIVERQNGLIREVKETKTLGIPPAKNGERDIGVFVFRKQEVFEILRNDAANKDQNSAVEHGFLCIISKLVEMGNRVEGYPIALPLDLLSFNTPEDLMKIKEMIGVS